MNKKPIFTLTLHRMKKTISVYPSDTRDLVIFTLICLLIMYILFFPCREWTGMMIERAFTTF
jgi:hypothetical protein